MNLDMNKLAKAHKQRQDDFLNQFSDDPLFRYALTIPDLRIPESADRKRVETYQSLVEIIEEQIGQTHQESGIQPTCSRGCSHCCNQAIYVTTEEAKIITHWIKQQHHSSFLGTVKRNLKSWFASYYKSGFSKDADDSFDFKQHYFQSRIPCPFLPDSKTCSIYPVRPTPCLTYFSYTDPSLCSKDAFGKYTFDGDRWRQILLVLLILSHEGVTQDPVLYKTHLDQKLILLPIAIKQQLD